MYTSNVMEPGLQKESELTGVLLHVTNQDTNYRLQQNLKSITCRMNESLQVVSLPLEWYTAHDFMSSAIPCKS